MTINIYFLLQFYAPSEEADINLLLYIGFVLVATGAVITSVGLGDAGFRWAVIGGELGTRWAVIGGELGTAVTWQDAGAAHARAHAARPRPHVRAAEAPLLPPPRCGGCGGRAPRGGHVRGGQPRDPRVQPRHRRQHTQHELHQHCPQLANIEILA